MTKTSIFGQSEVKQEKKKPIEFVKLLDSSGELNGVKYISAHKPSGWKNVTLLELGYNSDGLDLMWAYDENPNDGCLFLGHWNDGIV